jgi:hypothetical protein
LPLHGLNACHLPAEPKAFHAIVLWRRLDFETMTRAEQTAVVRRGEKKKKKRKHTHRETETTHAFSGQPFVNVVASVEVSGGGGSSRGLVHGCCRVLLLQGRQSV